MPAIRTKRDLRDAAVISALRLYEFLNISSSAGRSVLTELTNLGTIAPVVTPTGRVWLTPRDARELADYAMERYCPQE